jgi:Ca2+:H+ antiporter
MIVFGLTSEQLLGLYIIIALAFLVYPDDASDPANPPKQAVGMIVRSVKTFVSL